MKILWEMREVLLVLNMEYECNDMWFLLKIISKYESLEIFSGDTCEV